VMGDMGRFDLFSRIKHFPFPGGVLKRPALAVGMLYYRIRDLLA
jgi:gamma-glutamylputrescine oxidase